MGNSIADQAQPQAIIHAPLTSVQQTKPVQQASQPATKQTALVQNIQQIYNQPVAQTHIAPQKLHPHPRKSVENHELHKKSKKQLPPLKKIRSTKKLDVLESLGKQNQVKLGEQNSQKEVHYISKTIGSIKSSDIEVSQLKQSENEDPNKFKQTRSKKMRVSRNSDLNPGAYFSLAPAQV